MHHIFGEQYELGLDYIQILYQNPTQILPILCLVSKENNTGKSTFIKWMCDLFQQNAVVVGNDAFSNNFNAGWAAKLIVQCEEFLIEKRQAVERLKSLSTAKSVLLEFKGKDSKTIDFFAKFILAGNNEDTFIYATNKDIRYWVRKIPVIKVINVDIERQLMEKIPAFLNFLNNRKMSTQRTSRMWFDPEILVTEALKKLRDANRPKILKDIVAKIRDLFIEAGVKELLSLTQEVNISTVQDDTIGAALDIVGGSFENVSGGANDISRGRRNEVVDDEEERKKRKKKKRIIYRPS
jgi:hypothetical protein